jgi:hypothetical protein
MIKFKDWLAEKELLEVNEALKIKKNWKFSDNSDSTEKYTIEINDSDEHSILDRIKDRTDIKINAMNQKLQAGIDYILNKANKDFFKKDINYIDLKYTKSNFKVIFMIKPKTKYLRISSIFNIDWDSKNSLKWEIKEFYNELPEFKNSINENLDYEFFTISNDSFMIELNERKGTHEVMLSDPNDIIQFEINE